MSLRDHRFDRDILSIEHRKKTEFGEFRKRMSVKADEKMLVVDLFKHKTPDLSEILRLIQVNSLDTKNASEIDLPNS